MLDMEQDFNLLLKILIMKNLTNFHKTVETKVGPCLIFNRKKKTVALLRLMNKIMVSLSANILLWNLFAVVILCDILLKQLKKILPKGSVLLFNSTI